MSSSRKIVLESSDKESFEVEVAVALECQTIKHMIEDDCAGDGIPLPNVSSKILSKIIEFCRKHVDADRERAGSASPAAADDELKAWDAEFIKVDQATLFDLILNVADMIKGKTPEEIRKSFNIKNDFTAEEEEEVRRENQWAFE
ncbi:hypothetical protein EUGRSUZ_F01672 [Eucalyptus grandis]|uniref:SKP1-like protein n=2 Tax=Eucalyptus grandis TaxID=71139 RepID=A0A059BPP4_EUCGR|nr:hypothetical protein EUGRSUZ_F01672 [Eucalyptus grandis]